MSPRFTFATSCIPRSIHSLLKRHSLALADGMNQRSAECILCLLDQPNSMCDLWAVRHAELGCFLREHDDEILEVVSILADEFDDGRAAVKVLRVAEARHTGVRGGYSRMRHA